MAVEGKKIEKNVNIDRSLIFSKIGPYNVYREFMPWPFELNVACKNPFVNERHPSFIIGDKFGEITHKAFNSSHRGDCISFVQAMFGVGYGEALNIIGRKFGIEEGTYRDIIGAYEQPKSIKPPVLIQVKAKKFGEEHIKYLQEYYISPTDLQFCRDTKVVAIEEWALNRLKMPLERGEVAFGYNLKNERGDWMKIYRPHAGKGKKWLSSIPFSEMHGLSNMEGCEVGIITKSIKDGSFLSRYITPCVCVVQAEDISAISQENVQYIKENCKRAFVSWDSDKTGVEACQAVTKETGWGYINPPKHLLEKGVTDVSDMAKLLGPQEVIDFFKQKISI